MRYLVFSKLLKLVSKDKKKSIAEQISSQAHLSEELLSIIAGLSLEEKVELLEAGDTVFNPESWGQFIQQLLKEDFILRLTKGIKSNSQPLAAEKISVLMNFPPAEVIDHLLDLLATKNESIRFEATAILIEINDPLIVQKLIKVLDQPKRWIPARVMEILHSYGELAVQELLAAFTQADQELQVVILTMLTKMSHPTAEPVFRQCLEAEEAEFRGLAAIGLGELGKGQEFLPKIIKDPEASVRLKALQIMEESQDPAVYNYYWIALQDANWLVRSKAAEALIEKGLLPDKAIELIRASKDNPDLLTEIFELAGELNQEAFIWKK